MDLIQLHELVPNTAHQATLDAERPDQMDAFGAFPPVINHARNNLDFALRRVLPTIFFGASIHRQKRHPYPQRGLFSTELWGHPRDSDRSLTEGLPT